MKTTVQFRFLQLVLSAVTGDKVTLALIHWDRRTPRTKFSLRNLPHNYDGDLATIERGGRDLVNTAEAKLAAAAPSVLGLNELVPVRTGLGAALQWTTVRTEEVADPDAHFQELLALVQLAEPASSRDVSSQRLLHDIREMGRELEACAQGRVETQRRVALHHEYVSPLSWKNGVWHHTMTLNLARSETDSRAATQKLVGQLTLSIPPQDRPVIVTLVPTGEKVHSALDEMALIQRVRDNARVLQATSQDRGRALEELRKIVWRDVEDHVR